MRKTQTEVKGRKPSKRERRELSTARKAALVASGNVYNDLARVADVSYSMVYKWMNAERTSAACDRAFEMLTGAATKAQAREARNGAAAVSV